MNCIDCLDRTNVAQFTVGMRALGQQLYAMGLRQSPILESRSQLVRILMHLYSRAGDTVSMQYGGSEAHKNVKNEPGKEKTKHREILTSIRRYYSNSFTDNVKQDAINIFLGHFIPRRGQPLLWELESDYYLHNFKVTSACKDISPKLSNGKELNGKKGTSTLKKGQSKKENESREDTILRMRKRREDAKNRVQVYPTWWEAPLCDFENIHSTQTVSPKHTDRFLRYYPTDEVTYFDKALQHSFMKPLDLSNEARYDTYLYYLSY